MEAVRQAWGRASMGRWAAAAASGVLLRLAYPPYDLGPLAWCALIPLLRAAQGVRGAGLRAALGGAAGLVWGLWLFDFGWSIATATPVERALAALGPSAVLAAFLAVHAWLAGAWLDWGRRRRRLWAAAWGAGLAWTALEVAAAHLLAGFSPSLGVTQWRLPTALGARLAGSEGLSALIAAVNVLIAQLFPPRPSRPVWPAGANLLAIAALLAWGIRIAPPPAPGKLFIALAQPNFSEADHERAIEDDAYMQTLFDRLIALSGADETGGSPAEARVIAWPETALRRPVANRAAFRQALADLARRTESVVIAGLPYVDGPRLHNTALVFGPAGELAGLRHKALTIPIAESQFHPGPGFQAIEAGGLKLGVAICSESIPSFPARRLARQGAEALIFLSSLSGLRHTGAMDLHAAFTVMRAVETGLPVAQASSVGRTLAALPDGSLAAWAEANEQMRVEAVLPIGGAPAPFVHWAEALHALSAGAALAGFALAARSHGASTPPLGRPGTRALKGSGRQVGIRTGNR